MRKLFGMLFIMVLVCIVAVPIVRGAYTRTWNASYEASPADTDARSEGAERIRDLKKDVRERLAKDHYMDIAGTDADHGEHSKVSFHAPQGSDPAAVSNKAFLYTKDVSSVPELFYEDEAAQVVKITSGGQLVSPWYLVSEANPSGATIVTFTGLTAGKTYRINWNVSNTVDTGFRMTLNSDGTSGNYKSILHTAYLDVLTTDTTTRTTTNGYWSVGSSYYTVGEIILRPRAGDNTVYMYTGTSINERTTSDIESTRVGGLYDGSAAVTSIQIFSGTGGTSLMTGKIILEQYKQ